jgi:hypothetical protein
METPKERKEYIGNWLADNMDLPEIGIKGLLGNIDVETGGTFSHTQKQIGGGTGYGLIQFSSPGQKEAYFKFVEDNNLQDSIDAQLLYIKNEFDTGDQIGGKNARRLRNIIFDPNLTTEQSARAWSDILIQPGTPHMDRRIEASKSAGGFIDMQEGGEIGIPPGADLDPTIPDAGNPPADVIDVPEGTGTTGANITFSEPTTPILTGEDAFVTIEDTGVGQDEIPSDIDTSQGFYSVNPAPGESGADFAARQPLPTLEETFPIGETDTDVDPLAYKPPEDYVSPRITNTLADRLGIGLGNMTDADTSLANELASGVGTGPSDNDPAYTDAALVSGLETINSYMLGSDAAELVNESMRNKWSGPNFWGGISELPENWSLDGWVELQDRLIDWTKSGYDLGNLEFVDADGEFQFLGKDRNLWGFGDESTWIRETDLVYNKDFMTPEEAMPFIEYLDNIDSITAGKSFTYTIKPGGQTIKQISDATGISTDVLIGRIRRDNNFVYKSIIDEQSAGMKLPVWGAETVSDLTYGRYQAIGSSGAPTPPDLNRYKISANNLSSLNDPANYALDTTTGKFISKTDYDNSKAYMYDSYEDRWLTESEFNNVDIKEYTVGGATVNPLAEITEDTVIQDGVSLTLPEYRKGTKTKKAFNRIGEWFTDVKNTELGTLPANTRVTIGNIADDMFMGLMAGFLNPDGKFDYEKFAIAGAGSFAGTNVIDAFANKSVIESLGSTTVLDLATKLNIPVGEAKGFLDIAKLGEDKALNAIRQHGNYQSQFDDKGNLIGNDLTQAEADLIQGATTASTHLRAIGGAAVSAITNLALGGDLEDAVKAGALTAGGVYGAEYLTQTVGLPPGPAGAIIGAALAVLQGGGVEEAGKGAAYGYMLSNPATAPFAYALMAVEFILGMKKPSNKTAYYTFDFDDFEGLSFSQGDYDPSKANEDNVEFMKKIGEPLIPIVKSLEESSGMNLIGDLQFHYGGRDGLYYTIGSRDISGTPREMFLNRLDYFDGRDQSTADGGSVYRSRRFGADQAGIAEMYEELLGELSYIVKNNITDMSGYTGKKLSLEETKTLLAKSNITGVSGNLGIRQGGKILLDKGGNVQYNKGNYGLVNKKGKAPPSARADDVPMTLKEGDFVLSQPAVALYGKDTIDRMLSRAATDAGKNLKSGGKVPVNVHNGEYIIPKNLTEYIGPNVLETMNNRGLMSVGERPNT